LWKVKFKEYSDRKRQWAVYEVFVTKFKEAETHAHRDCVINKIYFPVSELLILQIIADVRNSSSYMHGCHPDCFQGRNQIVAYKHTFKYFKTIFISMLEFKQNQTGTKMGNF
jgi:hypothetical protein